MAPDPPGFFPPPLTIPPLTPPHKQTIILLHGRGTSARNFGPALVSAPFPFPSIPSPSPSGTSPPPPTTAAAAATMTTTTTLRAAFPHAKFVFPCAPRQRATIYRRSVISQWFDGGHLGADGRGRGGGEEEKKKKKKKEREDGQQEDVEEWRAIAGLQHTVAHVHELVRAEAAGLSGSGGVVLGGFSQGCAAALAAALLWDGPEALGGFVGMCGWLPFAGVVRGAVAAGLGEGEEDGWDPFERDGQDGGGVEEGDDVDVVVRVVRALRERLEMEVDKRAPASSRPRAFDTPIFLGHGDEDDKVPIARGKEAVECLRAAGCDVVSWNEYPGLGHWYSPEMLADMTSFLRDQTGWGEREMMRQDNVVTSLSH